MAMAALLRSVATKMARAPPRLLVPTCSGGNRFSTSTGGSVPSSANIRGPQNYNKELPGGSEWNGFISGVKDAAPKAAFGLVFGGLAFLQFYVVPALDRINAQMDALCDKMEAFNKEMKQRNERRHAALGSMGSQIVARDPRDVVAFNKDMKQRNERRHAALDFMGSQIEARDPRDVGESSKGQRIQASGHGKD